jgi:bifunctional enzyme Fae/Hps
MSIHTKSKLNPKKRYLQVALNNTLEDAFAIINSLPISDRIIIEAGTPFIKQYGADGIRQIVSHYQNHLLGITMPIEPQIKMSPLLEFIISQISKQSSVSKLTKQNQNNVITPYVVADLKTMDRAETEVKMAAMAGASAAIALGTAPTETLNSFISECEKNDLDAMIDMMNVEYPLSVLRALKKIPPVVILHRGVDEEKFNREKMIPLHEIRRIKGNYNIMIAIAGGDTLREVQSSIFNDADIVVVWKSVFQKNHETSAIVDGFLKQIK